MIRLILTDECWLRLSPSLRPVSPFGPTGDQLQRDCSSRCCPWLHPRLFLVLLSTVKLWHLFRLNPKMNMITSALHRAWGDISGFIVVILIMLLAYSIAVSGSFGKTFWAGLLRSKGCSVVESWGLGKPWESEGDGGSSFESAAFQLGSS